MELVVAAVAAMAMVVFPMEVEAQQSYVNNKQLDCYQSPNTTLGFVCNSPAPSCSSFLTFRSTPIYNSPATIAYLLSADASQIASANNISDVAPLPLDTLVVVPVNCSCSAPYLQHNASYALKSLGETYFSVANNTYQALSTCQALIAQNPFDSQNLLPGMKLTVPLRCACPTRPQIAAGFSYLLTYLVRPGDSYTSIAAAFAGAGADVVSILDANMLSEKDLIFFFTPLLVPLKIPPTKENIKSAASPPLAVPPPPAPPSEGGGSSSNKWLFIGIGIGAMVLVIFSSVALIWFLRHRRSHSGVESPPPRPTKSESATPPPPLSNWSESSEGIRSAMETLTIYRVEDLEKATNSFAESNRINGSVVYRGSFKGDDAVVKVIKGDVSREIDALRQINHSRIVRLSGFCLHHGTSYLVYEFADNGSLAECLRRSKHDSAKPSLDWVHRVQIAYNIADALNYLHNFTNPPYIHKNLTTTNILLDGNMRAKLANFGLARAVDTDNGVITRHVVGAQGYLPHEYIDTGLITPKLDIFAFGVVMLELLSGREPVGAGAGDGKELVLLSQTIQGVLSGDNVREKLQGFMDKSLGEEYPLEQAYTMAQLAKTCVAHNLDARPPVSEVFMALSVLRSSSLDWDPLQDTSISFSE